METPTMQKLRFVLVAGLLCCFGARQGMAQLPPNAPVIPVPKFAQPLPASLLYEERGGVWLVEAKSTGIDKTRLLPQSIVTITHNYTGSDAIIGQSFIPSRPFNTGSQSMPLIPLGAEGIFVIKWYDGAGKFITGHPGYNFKFLSFDKVEIEELGQSFLSYAEAKAYAQNVERVAKSPREKQRSLLQIYAKSSLPQRSPWAISTLEQSGLDDAPTFLWSLLKEEHLPIAGRLALDHALESLDSSGKVQWSATSLRADFLKQLVTSEASEFEASSISARLLDISQDQNAQSRQAKEDNKPYTPAIQTSQLSEWLRLASVNPKWAKSSRDQALGTWRWFGR